MKRISLGIAVLLTLSVFAGCGGTEAAAKTTPTKATTTTVVRIATITDTDGLSAINREAGIDLSDLHLQVGAGHAVMNYCGDVKVVGPTAAQQNLMDFLTGVGLRSAGGSTAAKLLVSGFGDELLAAADKLCGDTP